MNKTDVFKAVSDVDFCISHPHRPLTEDYIEGIKDCQEAVIRGLYLYGEYMQWKEGLNAVI